MNSYGSTWNWTYCKCMCIDRESESDRRLMEKYPFVYGAFGIHPDDAEKMTEDTLNEIRRLCHLPKAVAIGEIGLDYYWHKEEREHEIQKKMFRAQMEIAREEKMPFMIHSRDAARDTLELVKECDERGNAWRDYPLFFLWKGNSKGIPEYGTLSWNWRSCDV